MASSSREQEQKLSAEDKKVNGESQRHLTPNQVRAGAKTVMTHKERQAFLKNSEIGKLLGFSHWPAEPQHDGR